MNFNEQIQISAIANEALTRIRNKRNEKTTEQLLEETRTKFDYSRAAFEEYSDDAFIKKIKLDTYIYENLLKQCPEDVLPQIQEHFSTYINCIKAIYEHINIEPKLCGFTRLSLENSETELNQESRRIIYEYLDTNYYKLSPSQRVSKFKDIVISEAKNLVITENISVNESVEHVYKAAIMSNLLENISFPFIIKSTINDLLESKEYRQIFDAEKLEVLWESYQQELSSISRILSLVI